MISQDLHKVLHKVLDATGYLIDGVPAPGVRLGGATQGRFRAREFSPDAMWRGESTLTVYFKHQTETPSEKQVIEWRRDVWNQGFAPLLWIVSPGKIELYNGFGLPQKNEDAGTHRLRTFELIEGELDQLDAFAGRLAMETGQFWKQETAVDRKDSVDQRLLSDLAALESDLVHAQLDRDSAQGLIGRSIFTQYLIDRNILTRRRLRRDYRHDALAGILRDGSTAQRLFDWLRDTFNGDMFPLEDPDALRDRHLCRVADFLDATDPKSGQMSLFPYRFDVIPVELISSIYEQFAHAAPAGQGKGQADIHYTRLSVVSLILDEITQGLSGDETVLDLTCGSGVFLVEALRRLVTLRAKGRKLTRQLVRSTLHRQVYGVDVSEAAVRVAAFSLYLTALELDPNPKLSKALKFEPLIGKTLLVGDAQNIRATPESRTALTEQGETKKFDLIVGNPPWSSRSKAAAVTRAREGGWNDELPPRGASLDFVFRAMHFASDKTRFGMILSAMHFFSRSSRGAAAARRLIDTLSPVTLINLSRQSHWLFPQAKWPAMILLGRHRPSRGAEITAVQVPWSPAGAKSHAFEIAPSDLCSLALADWERRPEFLKAAFFGCRRDMALLDRLMSRHDSLDAGLQALNTQLRTGLTVGNKSRDSRFLKGLPRLSPRDLRPFSLPDDLPSYDAPAAERPRSRETYRAPLLIIKQVLGNSRPIVAVAQRDMLFTNACFGAALAEDQSDAAHLLAAILSSSLASWFLLMTSSTIGLWAPRMAQQDIERIPVPDLEVAQRSEAGQRLAQLVRDCHQCGQVTENDWRTLDEAVFDLYDLDAAERIVARDGLFAMGWEWPRGRDVSVATADTQEHVLEYAHAFLAAVDPWLSATRRCHMRAEVFALAERAPHRVVRFVIEDAPGPAVAKIVPPDGALRDVLERIGERLHVQIATSLIGQRELRVYGLDEIVIVKPAARRHWMGVSALEDADAAIVASVTNTASAA